MAPEPVSGVRKLEKRRPFISRKVGFWRVYLSDRPVQNLELPSLIRVSISHPAGEYKPLLLNRDAASALYEVLGEWLKEGEPDAGR